MNLEIDKIDADLIRGLLLKYKPCSTTEESKYQFGARAINIALRISLLLLEVENTK